MKSSSGFGHLPAQRPLKLLLPVALLVGAQAIVLALPLRNDLRPLWSQAVLLVQGAICLYTSLREPYRDPEDAYYWRWLSASFLIWTLGQVLSIILVFYSNEFCEYLDDVLFSMTIIPFSMFLFVDREQGTSRFDPIYLLDLSQVLIHWVAVYFCFAPAATGGGDPGTFGWMRLAAYNGMVSACLLFRAALERSGKMRLFFSGIAVFIMLSGAADSYATYPTVNVTPGHWFDMVWTVLLAAPIAILALSSASRMRGGRPLSFTQSIAYHVFPLLYPAATLLMFAQVARRETALASILIIVCFVLLGARMLIIQSRLLGLRSRLQFEATHDALTGVLSRGAIMEALASELQRCRRTGEPIGAMMIDLDHFKNVNDTYGHEAGDQVLQETVKRINGELRSYDLVGRVGGEEFIVVVPNSTPSELEACAERLRVSIGKIPAFTASGCIPVTASFGIVSSRSQDGVDAQELLREADSALYRAKANGRNRVEFNSCPERMRPAPAIAAVS